MKLQEPFQIKDVKFQSRITMAPMVPFGFPEGEQNSISDEVLEYYKKRIHGDLGLLITMSFSVDARKSVLKGYGLYNEKQKEALGKLIQICHENHTRILVQLSFPSNGHHRHDTIDHWSKEELKEIEDEFVESAKIVRQLGGDGVELHGANMFFLNLFSSPISNTRKDEYGGDIRGRLHLASNIIHRIQSFSGPDFIIGYRMGWNQDLETDIATAKVLEYEGVELLHISYGIREADRYMPEKYAPVICYPGSSREKIYGDDDFPYNDVVYTGTQIHKAVNIPVILVDEIWTFERGEELLQQGAGDLIAYGRPFLADWDFVEQSEANPAFKGCYRCKACAWFDDYSRCPKVKQRNNNITISR